jgi:hypothetical protein
MNLLFGMMGNNGIPADEKVVRATATPVDSGAPAAVEADAPQWGEKLETDGNSNLGIVNRTKASHWIEGEQSAPFWQTAVDQQATHNFLIDRQISTSGTAAAREAAGQFGHGTLSYAVGIEPQGDLREGGKLGNDYFAVGKPNIQSTMGDYMTVPPGYDHEAPGKASATGKVAAREAAASPYDEWWRGGQ